MRRCIRKEEKILKEAHIKSGGVLKHPNSKYRTSCTNGDDKPVISKKDQERFNREQERKRDQAKEKGRIEVKKDNIMMRRYDK